MNRLKHGLILLAMALAVMCIALSSAYTKTSHYMNGINHIKASAYKR